MKKLKGFPEWYCWLHKIDESSSINEKRRVIGILSSLGLKDQLPKFLKDGLYQY